MIKPSSRGILLFAGCVLAACSAAKEHELAPVAGSAVPNSSQAGSRGSAAGVGAGASGGAGSRANTGGATGAGAGGDQAPSDAGDDARSADANDPPDAATPAGDAAGDPDDHDRWVTTWGSTLIDLSIFSVATFDDVTLRQVVHTSVGGERVRVRFSNAFGVTPLVISAAHLALSATASSIMPGSDHALTFAGATSVTIEPGKQVTSDPISFAVPKLTNLTISLDLPEPTLAQTAHSTALQDIYVADRNGVAGATDITVAETLISWAFLEAVDVETASETPALVAFGDSITDGWQGTNNTNQRWPDELARRLDAAGMQRAVVNEAFSGNQVLTAGAGDAALVRFERDVLANSGVTHVIVLEGINDIGLSAADAPALIDGYEQLVTKAHGAGLKIIFGTVCPFEGAAYYSEQGEATRSALNSWLRTSTAIDGVIDFDMAVRDPSSPKRLLPAYDSGDFLHPSDAGYIAMGKAVDLALFE